MKMRQILLGIAIVVVALTSAFSAQERATLTAPITHASATYCDLQQVHIILSPVASITATLKCEQGEIIEKTYNGTTNPTGATLLHSLNIGNFSGATSMVKSVYNRLITDAVIAGTISGSAQ